MENKKMDLLFGVVIIAFLLVTVILIKEFNVRRAHDYKEYTTAIASIVKSKNDKIKILASQIAVLEKENTDLKNTVASAKSDLDALTKKLAAPAPAPAAAAK